jgi:hypothetical protein
LFVFADPDVDESVALLGPLRIFLAAGAPGTEIPGGRLRLGACVLSACRDETGSSEESRSGDAGKQASK